MEMSRDYLGNHICENDTLVYTETPVGFIKNDTIYAYVKDYRGNVRSVIDEFGNVAETNLFYPYGGLMTDDTQPSVSVQMRKFEGKEFDREYGQNVYDYHARMYDPYLCGFNSRDPQAEKYPDISPYAFCAANPNRFIDPTGEWIVGNDNKAITYTYNNQGTIQWSSNIRNDTKLVLNAMMKTNIGTKQVETMLKTNYPILIFTSDYEGFENTGRTNTSLLRKGENVSIINAYIEINVHDIKVYGDYDAELKNLTIEDRIGTVGVHESEHATNPQAVANARDDKSTKEAEKIANHVTYQHLEELKKQYSNH